MLATHRLLHILIPGLFFCLLTSYVHAAGPYSAVASGRNHVCALNSTATVECNLLPFANAIQTNPFESTAFSVISTGRDHICGISIDGGVKCWGDDAFGRLDVPEFSRPIIQLDAGAAHTCVLDDAGKIACWGLNNQGQSDAPASSDTFVYVVAGRHHSCAVRDDGEVACWGQVSLDVGLGAILPLPSDLPLMQKIDLSSAHACGLTLAQRIYCWGYPVPSLPDNVYFDVVLSEGMTCGVLAEGGALECRVLSAPDGLDAIPPSGTGFQQLTGTVQDEDYEFANDYGLCGLDAGGDIQCWGRTGPLPPPPSQLDLLPPEWTPINLIGLVYSDTYIELFWNIPTPLVHNAFLQSGIEIEINGVVVDTTTNSNSYNLFDPEQSTDLAIRIRVQHADGRFSDYSETVTVNTDSNLPGDTGDQVPAVTGLRVDVYGKNFAELFWDRPIGKSFLYRTFIDGDLVDETDGVSWWSRDFPAGSSSEVSVVAVDSNGSQSVATTVTVITPGN